MRRRVMTTIAMLAASAGAAGASAHAPTDPAGCPRHSPAAPTRQSWAPARLTLAPGGATSLQVCRYSGLNARPRQALTAGARIRQQAEVDRVVWRLDRLTPGPPGPVSCPSDDESQIRVVLGYPGAQTVTISVGLSGCGAVTNGAVGRSDAGVANQPGPVLLRELAADARRR